MPTATKDALSGIYIPQSLAEWATFPGVSSPSAIWRMQNASGSLTDSVAGTFTLAPTTPVLYAQPITGWTSVGAGFNDGAAGNFSTTSLSLPDLSTQTQANSFALLTYLDLGTPATTRNVISVGASTLNLQMNSSAEIVLVSGVNTATGTHNAASGPGLVGDIVPALLVVNNLAGTIKVYTSQEVIIVTPGAMSATPSLIFGDGAALDLNYFCGYGTMWIGAGAQFTDASAYSLLVTLGYSPLWSSFADTNFVDTVVLSQNSLSAGVNAFQIGTNVYPQSVIFGQDSVGQTALHLAMSGVSTVQTVWMPVLNGSLGLITGVAASGGIFSNGMLSLAASNGYTFGLNASTVTVQGPAINLFEHGVVLQGNLMSSNGLLSLQRMSIPVRINATEFDVIGALTVAGSTQGTFSLSVGMYTIHSTSISLVSSGSTSYSWASGAGTVSNSYAGISGTRYQSIGIGTWVVTPGDYVLGFMGSIAGVAGTTGSLTIYGASALSLLGPPGVSNYTQFWDNGILTVSTASLPTTIALANVSQTGGLELAQPYFRLIGSGE